MNRLLRYSTYVFVLFLFCWSCLIISFPWQELGKRISYYLWQRYKLAVSIEDIHYSLPLTIQAKIGLLSPQASKIHFPSTSLQCRTYPALLKLFLGKLELTAIITGQTDPELSDSQHGKTGTDQNSPQLKLVISKDLFTDKIALDITTPGPFKGKKIPITLPGGEKGLMDGKFSLKARLQSNIKNGLDLQKISGQGSLLLEQGTLHLTNSKFPVPDLSTMQGRIVWQVQNGRLQLSSVKIKTKGADLQLTGNIRLPKGDLRHDFYSRCLISVQGNFQYGPAFQLYSILKGIWHTKELDFQITGTVSSPRIIF